MNLDAVPATQIEAIRFFADGKNCHSFLAEIRWPDGVHCAHCGSAAVGTLVETKVPSRAKQPGPPMVRRLWNCKACRKQFTVKTGTIFEDSALGLDKWLPALWLIVNAKNGISSCELARSLGVTQKTAWFMLHRIRLAMREGTWEIKGQVEADEAYIGGSLRNISKHRRKRRGLDGKGSNKTMVHGLLERAPHKGGSKVIIDALGDGAAIAGHVRKRVRKGSELLTDSATVYPPLGKEYVHGFVDHAVEYARGHVHTNGLENFWSLLKRTIRGTYVKISPYHLFRYLDEQAMRFNDRADDDRTRFLTVLQRVTGRRLRYDVLTTSGLW